MPTRRGRLGSGLSTTLRAVHQALLLLAILGLAGCSLTGDDGGASFEVGELKNLVLQPEDLPRSFMRFDEGRQIAADLPEGARADPARFGRQDGWKARYRQAGTVQTAGPLVIESKADVFDSEEGAEDDFEAARAETDESEPEWQPIGEPGLGDESFAATLLQGPESSGVRFYQVVWREDNAVASLNVNGFARGLALEDALELARAQERRIEAN
jgi:hypothetical protein